MKKPFLIIVLMFNTSALFAQQQTTEDININSAAQMAEYLRHEYSIAKAVYLTQVAKQLADSFASTEQLKQQWQQALSTEISEPTEFTQINTHALMAQTLIQYTNGMSLNRWRQVDLPMQPIFHQLSEAYVASQTFDMWVNLNYHWQTLLSNESESNLKQWHPWLSSEILSSDRTETKIGRAHV